MHHFHCFLFSSCEGRKWNGQLSAGGGREDIGMIQNGPAGRTCPNQIHKTHFLLGLLKVGLGFGMDWEWRGSPVNDQLNWAMLLGEWNGMEWIPIYFMDFVMLAGNINLRGGRKFLKWSREG